MVHRTERPARWCPQTTVRRNPSAAAATIGTATMEFGAPCPRCVMVTREIDAAISADRAVLRHIVRDLDQNVGVYATIVTPGHAAVGDLLTLL